MGVIEFVRENKELYVLLGFVLFVIALYGVIGYVAYHFISKWW